MLPLILLAAMSTGPRFCHDVSALTRHHGAGAPPEAAPVDQDVVHYDIDLEILPSVQEIEGACEITFTPSASALTQLVLELRSLDVVSVTSPYGGLSWTHEGDTLTVQLASSVAPGDTSSLVVQYEGHPWNEGPGKFGGFWFHPYVSYQMGVGVYTMPPSMGKCFFPCHDHPADKATFEFHVTVDDSVEVVANGDLTGVTYSGGKATWHWELDQPMSTYLAAIAASDYVDLVDSTYSWIHYYVYPSEVADALGSFQNVDKMMTLFQALFGPYPWDCKFSYVETPKGDMEHATEVYHLQSLINGQTNFDPIVAHEMGHMWWGDCVTESEWDDVWLSEGFATYCEALWAGYYGASSYDSYMVDQIMIPYLQSGEIFPLGAPEELWGYTTYEKGASVLHMLRHILGDEDFFEVLSVYFDAHAFSLATTQDLRDCIESVTGSDIDWFIDEWVYGYGYPAYDISTEITQSGSMWDVEITVSQIQGTGTFFTMPLEFSIGGAGSDTLVVMLNDQQGQTGLFSVPFQPTLIRFDPGHFVLSTALLGTGGEPSPPPGGTGLMRLYPNPASSRVSLSWPGMTGTDMSVTVYDLTGRVVARHSLEAGAMVFGVDALPGGTYLVEARAPGNLRQVARLTVARVSGG